MTINSTKKAARVAGLLYLATCIPAPFSLLYVPGKLIVSGNAAATAKNILASEWMFRLGIAGQLVSAIAFLFAVRALYRLLQGVDKRLASLSRSHSIGSWPKAFSNEPCGSVQRQAYGLAKHHRNRKLAADLHRDDLGVLRHLNRKTRAAATEAAD